ncbi:MAG: hypothetical protein O3A51_07700, partial [Verrucomicrobia bacterium]|nr:hypothetical protein [Verrucomicrobiota bacterium]
MKSERIYPVLAVIILLLLLGSGVLAYRFYQLLTEDQPRASRATETTTEPASDAGFKPNLHFGIGDRDAPGSSGHDHKWLLRRPDYPPVGTGPFMEQWNPDWADGHGPLLLGFPLMFEEDCDAYGGEFSFLATGADLSMILNPGVLCLEVDRQEVYVPENQTRRYQIGERSFSACDLDQQLGLCLRFGDIVPDANGTGWHPMYAPRTRNAEVEYTNLLMRWHAPFMDPDGMRTNTVAPRHQDSSPTDLHPSRNNYFLSSNPRDWFNDLPAVATSTIRDFRPGIDLSTYADQNRLEYVFTFWPGVTPDDVSFQFDDAYALRLLDSGNLAIEYDQCATLIQHRPHAYRWIDGYPVYVETDYLVNGKSANIQFHNEDIERLRARQRTLLTDPDARLGQRPVVDYLSYLGGAGDDIGFVTAIDGSGYAYIAGSSSSPSFATGHSETPKGIDNIDVVVSKFRISDGQPIYTTFLGGRHDDRAFDMVADSDGNIYICGETLSPDFASVTTPPGGVLGRAWEAFVVKLDPQGEISDLAFRLGGTGDDRAFGIALDTKTNI